MATGYVIQLPDGSTKQVPFSDASKYADPNQLSQWNEKIGLPSQNLQEGALNIQGKTIQNAVAGANAPADIAIKSADAVKATNEQDKINAIANAGDLFEKNKGKDNKVSPQDYNNQLAKYVKLGGTSDDFNAKFQDKYVNPNNVFYDTPDNIAVRKTLPQIGNIIKSYASLGKAGPNWDKLVNLPVVGDLIKKNGLSAEIAHDANANGLSAEILKVAGAGQGSTIRGSLPELTRITSLLPLSTDSRATANEKLSRLDSFLQKTYGTKLDDWMK